ncbi:MAG: ankyrin repeat domain-containing protein [Burkholderiales bacterium]
MQILEYIGLDTTRVKAQYERIKAAIARDDFRQAEVKKLANLHHGKFYRAKLDHANRLLFSLVRHGETTYALMLEVIAQHDYAASRFLRGALIDEEKIPDFNAAADTREAEAVRYIHPERREIHLLDKVLSFDDTQEEVYRLPAPLIVVGSAGSGKTALTLEKLKHAEGEVLYVTLSAYLAKGARDLYYAHGFERDGQDAQFLSYRELVESLHVPAGREALWRDFSAWFTRQQQQVFKGIDAHQAFEEIRGVITAPATGPLARADYLALGVRQSIFPESERGRIYDLFERYRGWLAEAKLYDPNLVAYAWRERAGPRYDFVVIDEVQDFTNVQLALVLATLKKPNHFLLCGDSNQIVHPNFFSWSKVKSLFWSDEAIAHKQELRILRANFRNGRETTRVANALLKIKHHRFGSIDRESNFLVDAVGGEAGTVTVLADKDAVTRDLNQKTRQSTRFAVLVMRDQDKAEARLHFQTPLIFSIHEAKGLEYENIVLYRFISEHRATFTEVVEGVSAQDLARDDLAYRRARDKSDKSLEIYKFYVNALYVALTRAIRNVYLIESDLDHPLLRLLTLRQDDTRVETAVSSLDDWQKEARKLELQGKEEQADAIRRGILKQVPVPWTVFDEAKVRETLIKVFREQHPGNKGKQQLYEYATCYDEPVLARWLDSEARFDAASAFERQRTTLGRKHFVTYFAPRFKDILQQCDRHGVDHRTPMNQTPLMAAAAAGNVALVEALLARGANPDLTDHLGRNALHWALLEAFRDAAFAKGPFGTLYDLLAPSAVDVMIDERLVRIDRHLSEYLLFQTLWALFKSRFHASLWRERGGFETAAILDAWRLLPSGVLRAERNQRQHLSHLLSRNELNRDYAYNRRLFMRVAHGWYQFNPALAVRRREGTSDSWVPIFEALNLRFVAEGAYPEQVDAINALLDNARLPPVPAPIAMERMMSSAAEAQQRDETLRAELVAQAAEKARLIAELQQARRSTPSWGTPEARRMELERIQREIAERAAARTGSEQK